MYWRPWTLSWSAASTALWRCSGGSTRRRSLFGAFAAHKCFRPRCTKSCAVCPAPPRHTYDDVSPFVWYATGQTNVIPFIPSPRKWR